MIQLGHLELGHNGWTEQLCTAWFDQHRPYPVKENDLHFDRFKIKVIKCMALYLKEKAIYLNGYF